MKSTNKESKCQIFELFRTAKDLAIRNSLITSILPNKLYKYFRPNNDGVNSLEEQYLWHAAPQSFNDPLDSQLGWIEEFEIGDEEFLERVNRSFATNLKICSLTEKNDSLPMWAHYGSNHTGFCVEYNFTNFISMLGPIELYPVHYTNQVLDLKSCYKSHLNLYNVAILASIAKQLDWEYENEWRLFFWNSIISNKIPSPRPTAIYYGAKSDFTDLYIKRTTEFASRQNIAQYQMKTSASKFELRAEILNI